MLAEARPFDPGHRCRYTLRPRRALRSAQAVAETQACFDRLRIIGGDFFRDPMPEVDAYILMEVIHDWDDDASRQISPRSAGRRPNAKLLLIEALLPNDPSPNWPTTLDIVMLAIGGRQRTLREYSDLLRDSGFVMTREMTLGRAFRSSKQ